MNNTLKTQRSLMVLGLLFAVAPLLADDELDGELEIRSAYAVPSHGTVLLSAHVIYPQSERISAALKDGVTLSFDLEVIVSRHRRLWFDADAVDLTRRRELSYHVISERFLLRDIEGNSQESFPTLSAALARLGHVEIGRSPSTRSCASTKSGRSACGPACAAAPCPMRCGR